MKATVTTKATQYRPWGCMLKYFIGGEKNPLVIRWTLLRTPWFSIMVHKLCRSDYERALHDHPWNFVSIVLWGQYTEVCENGVVNQRRLWSAAYRPATWKHRVELRYVLSKDLKQSCRPCWTLMLISGRKRSWGFWMPDGSWCWWRKHNPDLNICEPEVRVAGGGD